MTVPAALELRGLRKTFGSHVVLDDVTLEVPAQSVTVVIGASGSGKSTLMRCVNLLEDIDDGQMLLAGQDVTAVGVDQDRVRARIGSVFQAYNLFPHMSVLDNITLAPRLVHGIAPAEADAAAMGLLARFGLAEKARAYPDLLSGGQQQRIAILRAVATSPELLLLDEVTSALDPLLVAEVLALVRELKADGMTMVIATHEMGFARSIADEVVFLADGRVHESGAPDRVFSQPQTQRLRDFLGALHDAGRW